MAAPNSILNTIGQSSDTLYDTAGNRMGKRGLKPTAATGLDNTVGHAAAATHEAGTGKWAAGGPVNTIAGINGTDVLPILVDATGRPFFVVVPFGSSFVDRSGTAGTSDATVAAANPTRKYLLFQNVSNVDLWIDFGTAAALDSPSIKVPPDAAITWESNFVPTEALHVISGTASKKYTCKEA